MPYSRHGCRRELVGFPGLRVAEIVVSRSCRSRAAHRQFDPARMQFHFPFVPAAFAPILRLHGFGFTLLRVGGDLLPATESVVGTGAGRTVLRSAWLSLHCYQPPHTDFWDPATAGGGDSIGRVARETEMKHRPPHQVPVRSLGSPPPASHALPQSLRTERRIALAHRQRPCQPVPDVQPQLGRQFLQSRPTWRPASVRTDEEYQAGPPRRKCAAQGRCVAARNRARLGRGFLPARPLGGRFKRGKEQRHGPSLGDSTAGFRKELLGYYQPKTA